MGWIATGRPPSPDPATTPPSPARMVCPPARQPRCSPWRSSRRGSRTPRWPSRPRSAPGPGTTRTWRSCCGVPSCCCRDGPTRPRPSSCAWVRRSGWQGRPRPPSGSTPLRRSCACTGATWRKPGGSCTDPAPVRRPAIPFGLPIAPRRWDGWHGRKTAGRRPPRFFAAALAVARFRLGPTPERAAQAQSLSAAAPWPWLGALLGCWRGELLADQQAAQAARGLFERIGADLGVQRAERVLRRLGAWPPSGTGAASPLSPRELEVAALVAEGLSNPAIARRLYLSRPTIAHHVAHVLTKLGFASRAQIAAWVVQQRGDGG